MVWFDDSGRVRLCEATCSGFLTEPMQVCFSTCSGFVAK